MMSFQTSDVSQPGDTSNAYFRAHLYAAEQAAKQKVPSHVIRDDTGNRRYGFCSPDAAIIPTTVLYKIMQMGLESCYDFASISWVPLKKEEWDVYTGEKISAPAKV